MSLILSHVSVAAIANSGSSGGTCVLASSCWIHIVLCASDAGQPALIAGRTLAIRYDRIVFLLILIDLVTSVPLSLLRLLFTSS
jgi:hypothetical protein